MRTSSDMLFEIAVASGRYSDPRSLSRFDTRVYSQNGEDGWIAEIFRRIERRDRFFVEIGVGTGQQNNTRLLLEQGWRGIWIERSETGCAEAESVFASFIRSGALTLVDAAVTTENVDVLLDRAGAPEAFDFLSLDIDRHTSHVWRALRRKPRVACIEYTASLPPSIALEVPYDPDLAWDSTSWCGASLKALERIGAAKGMRLVGCELMGVNAFFVAAGATDPLFRSPFTAEEHWEPARYDRNGKRGHRPSTLARTWVADQP